MRNVTNQLCRLLPEHAEVLPVDVSEILSPRTWIRIRLFNPDIIHYLHGPTVRSFVLTKSLSLCLHKSRAVMSSMRPYFSPKMFGLIRALQPDYMFVQSVETEKMFTSLGFNTHFMPSGVDTQKFSPIAQAIKQELRKKYGIDESAFIVLHVGSVKQGRGVHVLANLQKQQNVQVVIAGPVSVGFDEKLVAELRQSGIIVWTKYFKNVEELYCLADCYVFPVQSRKDSQGRASADSIEMPLSVLEAMACNLPVIASKFGTLPRVFEEGEGFFFATSEAEFVEHLREIRQGVTVKTREKVLKFSWENIILQLKVAYESVLNASG